MGRFRQLFLFYPLAYNSSTGPDGLNIDDIHIYAWLLIMKWKSECGHDL